MLNEISYIWSFCLLFRDNKLSKVKQLQCCNTDSFSADLVSGVFNALAEKCWVVEVIRDP